MTAEVVTRLLYGLDRIPRSLPDGDLRLPGVTLERTPLRLNTVPVPRAILADAGDGHTARVAAATAWLQAACGDYAVPRRRFIAAYMEFIAAELARHQAALALALDRYDGLFAVEDWTWSALRPLPRAWIVVDGAPVPMDVAFWDGATLTAACAPPARPTLHKAGIATLPLDGSSLDDTLPPAFHAFWRGELLPRSPFRPPEPRSC